jgi:hypothetical protein
VKYNVWNKKKKKKKKKKTISTVSLYVYLALSPNGLLKEEEVPIVIGFLSILRLALLTRCGYLLACERKCESSSGPFVA